MKHVFELGLQSRCEGHNRVLQVNIVCLHYTYYW